MLGKTDPQGNFFDSYIEEYFLPKEHELLKIKENVDFSFIENKTKDLYSKEMGRPSHPPKVMFKILFLEFYYNLSDVEVARQLKFNVLFRYFTDLKAEDLIPDDTSLVVFRRRLGEERFERVFDEFVNQCKKKGLLHEKLKATDATHIVADVAIPNTVNLLREGRKGILRAIEKEQKELAEPLKRGIPLYGELYSQRGYSRSHLLNSILFVTGSTIFSGEGNFQARRSYLLVKHLN